VAKVCVAVGATERDLVPFGVEPTMD